MSLKPIRTPGRIRRQKLFDEWLSDPFVNGVRVTFIDFQGFCDAGQVAGLEPEGFAPTHAAGRDNQLAPRGDL